MKRQILADNQISDHDNESEIALMCINARWLPRKEWDPEKKEFIITTFEGAGLVEGKRYTSKGDALNDGGLLCYQIKEINNGELKLAERFRILKTQK